MLLYSIIIPVYNKYELTRDCLLSLKDHSKHNNFEVIVVDNASSDETQTEIPKLGTVIFPERFTYIRNDENLNFAGACNQGAKTAKAEYLFFLNNDTVMTENWDIPLIEALKEDQKLGAVGPVLLYANNTVQHIGVSLEPNGTIGHIYRYFPAEHPVVRKRRKLNIITAAALMIPKTNFFLAGAFNEAYKNGFEDVELCLKLRALGFELSVIPESTVYHLESQSPGRNNHELHNTNILINNNPIFPRDKQNILIDDDYEVSLNEDFSLSFDVSKNHKIHEKIKKCTNNEELLGLLYQEPYWHTGYNQLAEICIKNNKMLDAYQIYHNQTVYYQREDNYLRMNNILSYLDKPKEAKKVEETLSKFNTKKKPQYIIAIYNSILASLEKYNNPQLKLLLKDWRKKYGVKYLATK